VSCMVYIERKTKREKNVFLNNDVRVTLAYNTMIGLKLRICVLRFRTRTTVKSALSPCPYGCAQNWFVIPEPIRGVIPIAISRIRNHF
jgi:hypothetical protein